MTWTRTPLNKIVHDGCSSVNCDRKPIWRFERDAVVSHYCERCANKVAWHKYTAVESEMVMDAARHVVSFDWSDNDPDAVAAMDDLRNAINKPRGF